MVLEGSEGSFCGFRGESLEGFGDVAGNVVLQVRVKGIPQRSHTLPSVNSFTLQEEKFNGSMYTHVILCNVA